MIMTSILSTKRFDKSILNATQAQMYGQINLLLSRPFRLGDLISFWIRGACECASFVAKASHFTVLDTQKYI